MIKALLSKKRQEGGGERMEEGGKWLCTYSNMRVSSLECVQAAIVAGHVRVLSDINHKEGGRVEDGGGGGGQGLVLYILQ